MCLYRSYMHYELDHSRSDGYSPEFSMLVSYVLTVLSIQFNECSVGKEFMQWELLLE